MEKLSIESVSPSNLGSNSYIILFRTEESNKLFPIIVGAHEAQIISVFMENLTIKRPVTHQLFLNFINLLKYKVEKVLIYHFEEGIFYSKIYFNNGEQELNLDSRPSDAIALAIKMDAPIYINKNILNEINIDEEEVNRIQEENANETEEMENVEEDLEEQLKQALENEDYELAVKIRDKMNKKEN